ncbi:hypothetical protein GOODEAATRI_001561 [Goodea atripinnis]|uniref:RING-type domain-containing protein n=1 Tax=Goodea atripinnis TaxID=208336 RepID=A0ABV0P0I8_9TELE
MTTARYRPTWELAVDPLVSCKLCLGEFPLEQMTTITQCQCVFCTLVHHSPPPACVGWASLTPLLSFRGSSWFCSSQQVLLDPCRTWCPSSTCQAVCQLKETDSPALPQLVQCAVCALEFCSACKANWHPGQACQESNLPIASFLPGENRYCFMLLGSQGA